MFFRTALLFALCAAPAFAQDDGGVSDAGPLDAGAVDAGEADAGTIAADAGQPDPCDPRCEGTFLAFCDGEEASTLNCADLDARCGELSAAWGADCLLAAGAACEPGYGFGESRCDRADSLYCIDGVCAVASGPAAPDPLTPSAGTHADSDQDAASDPFACSSCTQGSAAGLFVLAGALRRLRRLRRS